MKYKEIHLGSVLSLLGNVLLAIIKSIVGIITGSNAMLSDAFNSLSDSFNSIMSIIGNKISSQPSDEDHHLGHGKAEYIFSMIMSLIMILCSIKLLSSSFKGLFTNYQYSFNISITIICIINIFIKFFLYLYTKKLATKYDNLLMNSLSSDHRNDILLTTLTLISSIFALFNVFVIDSIVGLIISFIIFITGYSIFKEAYDVLMDKRIDDESIKEIIKIVNSNKDIIKYQHLNTTPVGNLFQVSITIFVDGKLSTFKSHEIADKLENQITSLPKIYLTIVHVNPIEVKK